jgi:hypothetical protein
LTKEVQEWEYRRYSADCQAGQSLMSGAWDLVLSGMRQANSIQQEKDNTVKI